MGLQRLLSTAKLAGHTTQRSILIDSGWDTADDVTCQAIFRTQWEWTRSGDPHQHWSIRTGISLIYDRYQARWIVGRTNIYIDDV